MTVVVHTWSAPRSRSTALLYSFEARSDCLAIDEPLYRESLIKRPVSRPHYGKAFIEGKTPDGSNPEVWERELKSLSERIQDGLGSEVVFCKHMAKHYFLYDFHSELEGFVHKHVLLIRDPIHTLSSWKADKDNHGDDTTTEEVGVVPLLSIYSSLQSVGKEPYILESDTLAQDPKEAIKGLCAAVGIPFMDSMMSWPSGPHNCDGPWAPWWYANVHKSSGWNTGTSVQKKYRTVHPSLLPCLRASMPAYEFLHRQSQVYAGRGPPVNTIYEDPRNEHLLAYIGAPERGRLLPREMAGVSPWDSSVQGGDAAWEGLRVYRGKILSLDKHLRRLFKSAKALDFKNVHTKEQVEEAIFETLAANGMRDGAHMRLTLTRGEKCTSSMNPNFNVYGTTLIILAEWKPTEGATTYDNTKGISLISASQRRNPPQTVDSKIHHNNLINNIIPKIQANLANCADAIMLDVEGYVSETNATNIFMVDDGVLLTPHADHCLPGITRSTVLQIARDDLGITVKECRISLAEFHAADEVFTTGTMGELTPVTMIDGRVIGSGSRGPITARLQEVYKTLPDRDGWATPIPDYTA